LETIETMRVSKENRPTDAEITERILGIARDRFVRAGVARTTVDEIAHDAGLSKKTVYRVFPSKEVLLRVLVTRFLAEFHHALRAAVGSDQPMIERFNAAMMLLAERISLLGSPLMVDVQRFYPSLWSEFVAFRRERIGNEFRNLIRCGIDEGVIRNDLSPETLLGAFTGAVEYLLVPSAVTRSPLSGPETLLEILSLFLEGVLTPRGREAAGSSRPEPAAAGGMDHHHHVKPHITEGML
jgi:AcrR family transcriptional regulator